MAVPPVTSFYDPAATALNNKKNDMSGTDAASLENRFLTLLIAQLQNQDPTNPMDNNQMTSQLAQIQTVTGIERLNESTGKLAGQLEEGQALSATNLIGRTVLVPGNKLIVGKDEEENTLTSPIGFELASSAEKVVITINNASGAVVGTVELDDVPAGMNSFVWDGKLEDGSFAPNGAYTFTLAATSGDDKVKSTPLFSSRVFGVIRGPGQTMLDLGLLGEVSFNEVRQVL
ncbi:flagellar hook assembly protein FlgD [Thorsellia anophelis]|uniref:Basal-body rod modification protein FlgD n=1 Tax=Thorsellia anophelis DSM 18579 TaxID=1123402 RepID=A0A1H9ZHP5_9GAMM|nr:flagellar hook assembly protein FlgD [Thorsellia anophelis]SES80341.1 flagellar basal-body rod modification protein FlgD [Thorsellia anophelis DSM 18579]